MIGGEWKRPGKDRQGPLLVPFRGPFRTHVGVTAGVILLRLEPATNVPNSDWVCLGVPGVGLTSSASG
jgi:hypothetical protein